MNSATQEKLINKDLDSSLSQLAGNLNIKGSASQVKKQQHDWQPKGEQKKKWSELAGATPKHLFLHLDLAQLRSAHDDGTSDGIQCSTNDAATRHDGSEANGIAVRAHHIPIRIHSERYEIHLVTIIQGVVVK
eukprot:XP_019921923.1 PREDICTED: uncharacterized protein LOC105326254 [Crassostrea gigas]